MIAAAGSGNSVLARLMRPLRNTNFLNMLLALKNRKTAFTTSWAYRVEANLEKRYDGA